MSLESELRALLRLDELERRIAVLEHNGAPPGDGPPGAASLAGWMPDRSAGTVRITGGDPANRANLLAAGRDGAEIIVDSGTSLVGVAVELAANARLVAEGEGALLRRTSYAGPVVNVLNGNVEVGNVILDHTGGSTSHARSMNINSRPGGYSGGVWLHDITLGRALDDGIGVWGWMSGSAVPSAEDMVRGVTIERVKIRPREVNWDEDTFRVPGKSKGVLIGSEVDTDESCRFTVVTLLDCEIWGGNRGPNNSRGATCFIHGCVWRGWSNVGTSVKRGGSTLVEGSLWAYSGYWRANGTNIGGRMFNRRGRIIEPGKSMPSPPMAAPADLVGTGDGATSAMAVERCGFLYGSGAWTWRPEAVRRPPAGYDVGPVLDLSVLDEAGLEAFKASVAEKAGVGVGA